MKKAEAALLVGAMTVVYTYAGYPLMLGVSALRSRRRDHPRSRASATDDPTPPSITVVIPAFNEAAVIAAKVANTRSLEYPRDLLDLVVVADGSDDDTASLARQAGATVLWQPERGGKSAAVNRGVAVARGDVVCLTDANCALAPGALRALASAFADERVAVVSGEKTVIGEGARGGGESLYWRFEAFLKKREAAFGATMGSVGEITGVRRSHFRPIPAGVINDDYHLACDALARGLRVTYAPGARSFEIVSTSVRAEFERRSRIAAGTWQTTTQHWTLADPRRGWTAVAFASHRVLRTLVIPVTLPFQLMVSVVLARRSRWAQVFAAGQALFYLAGAVGTVADAPVLSAPFQFTLTNLATIRGGWLHLGRRQPVQWRRAGRAGWLDAPRPSLAPGSRVTTHETGPA